MSTKYMLFDPDRCFGCNACVVACQQEYGLPAAIKFNRVDVKIDMAAPLHREKITFQPLLCNQCDNAPCQKICPVVAITRDAVSGVVLTDRAKCVGCRLCTTASGCPYGMRAIDGAGKSVKCNFCLDRITGAIPESRTYCVKTCPTKARKMVEVQPSGTSMTSRGGAIPKVYYGNIPKGEEQ